MPAAAASLPDTTWLLDYSYLDFFATALLPALDRAIEAEFKNRADARLAAAALAVAAYQADHGDDLPPTLGALVPTYLPRVPIDPMSADGDLKYDAARGLLWSAGADGRDDGGDATTRPDVRVLRDARWDARDAVVSLRRE